MPGGHWSEKEKEILVQLAKKGCTTRDASKVLRSRSLPGIDKMARLMGLSLRGPAPEIDFDEFRRIMKK